VQDNGRAGELPAMRTHLGGDRVCIQTGTAKFLTPRHPHLRGVRHGTPRGSSQHAAIVGAAQT
jgi:hypothetical protein